MASNNKKIEEQLDASARYVEFLGGKLVNLTEKFEVLSSTLKNTLDLENKNRNIVSNKLAMNAKEIDAAFKTAKAVADKFGRTAAFNSDLEGARASVHKLALSGANIQEDRLMIYLENFISKHISSSKKAIERGEEPTLKKVDVKAYKPVIDEIEKKLGIKGALSGVQNKLISFFGDLSKDSDKKRKGLVNDLIEGLASSKFIGGAINDTFKLIGLLGASWLSKFGQLGRILGGVFYVAMSTLGPTFANMIVSGLGKLISWGTKAIVGALLKGGRGIGSGIVRMSAAVDGPLGMFTPGKWGMMSTAGKAASVGRLAGAVGVAAGAGIGAAWAGKEAADSWKKGRKGNALAFGAGAGALGLGAVAALIAGAFAPVTLILVGVGAAVAGIAAFWKKFGDGITDWFKKLFKKKDEEKERDKDEKNFWQRFWDWLKDFWPFGGGGNSNNDGNTSFGEKLKRGLGIQDTKVVGSVGDISYNKQGAATNIGSMDRMQASAAAQKYRNEKPEQFENVYELVGAKHASLGSFQNDWAIRNSKGAATQAVLYKGASANLEQFWDKLVAAGMTRERAQMLKYTSGRATKTSGHKKSGSWKSHDNLLGLVTDMAEGGRWTDAEWKMALEVLQPIAKEQGFELMYEGNYGGSTHFSKLFRGGLSNRHFHVQPLAKVETAGAQKNEEAYKKNKQTEKAEATKHTGSIKSTIKSAIEAVTKPNYNQVGNNLQKEYAAQGYTYDKTQNKWVKPPVNKNDKVSFVSPTGNDEFSITQQTMNRTVMFGTNEYVVG